MIFLMRILLGFVKIGDSLAFDFRGAVIFAVIILISKVAPKYAPRLIKKSPSPIVLILISAALGMILYSI